MPYGDHLEEGSPRGVSLEPLRKLERVEAGARHGDARGGAAATHVALRAAVAREKTARSVFVAKERKLDGARSYRAMMDAEKTRIAEALRNEEAASEEEVIDLACRMIKRTSLIFPKSGWGTKKGVRLGEPLSGATAKFAESKSPRRKPRQAPPETGSGWFRLFKRMDDDGSGKITYGELEALVRRDLEVSTTELPDRRLKAVWRALDADGSGYLTAGEFGHFMKRGEAHLQQLHPEQSWKQLLHRESGTAPAATGGEFADARTSSKHARAEWRLVQAHGRDGAPSNDDAAVVQPESAVWKSIAGDELHHRRRVRNSWPPRVARRAAPSSRTRPRRSGFSGS